MATTKIGPGVALTHDDLQGLEKEARALPEGWTVEAVAVRSTGAFNLNVTIDSPGFRGVVSETFEFGRIEDARAFLKRLGKKYPQS